MKVVSLKSTTTSLPPCPITSSSCCLNSGAVYRSTSPASEMTYAPFPSCSVLMSKFNACPERCGGSAFPAARSLTAALFEGCPERRDLRADPRLGSRVPLDLQKRQVGRERHLVVPEVLGRLRQVEIGVLSGPDLGELLEGRNRLGRSRRVLRRRLLDARGDLRAHRLGDRILTQGLAELARGGRPEGRAGEGRLLLGVCSIRVYGRIVGLRVLQAPQPRELRCVLRRERRVLLERRDRLVGAALALERVRKVPVRLRVARVRVHLFLGR